MAQLINPRMVIKILGSQDTILDDPKMRAAFDIEKDLQEEPNEAELNIFGLNPDYQSRIVAAAEEEAPIKIYLTPGGRPDKDPVQAFVGEIETAKSVRLKPGVESIIRCTSQKKNHRSFFFQRNFAANTPLDQIILALVDAIGLPRGNDYDLPTNKILLSESFSGAAFPLLQRYVFDLAMYTYILDGKLFITSIFDPPDPRVFLLTKDFMLSAPEQTTRLDRTFVQMQTIVEADSRSPFPPKRKKRKRKNKPIKVVGLNDFVEYEAVEEAIRGMDFHHLCIPGQQPDNLVQDEGRLYRIQSLNHFGNTDGGGWDTRLLTDEYDATAGDLLADVTGTTGGGDLLIL